MHPIHMSLHAIDPHGFDSLARPAAYIATNTVQKGKKESNTEGSRKGPRGRTGVIHTPTHPHTHHATPIHHIHTHPATPSNVTPAIHSTRPALAAIAIRWLMHTQIDGSVTDRMAVRQAEARRGEAKRKGHRNQEREEKKASATVTRVDIAR